MNNLFSRTTFSVQCDSSAISNDFLLSWIRACRVNILSDFIVQNFFSMFLIAAKRQLRLLLGFSLFRRQDFRLQKRDKQVTPGGHTSLWECISPGLSSDETSSLYEVLHLKSLTPLKSHLYLLPLVYIFDVNEKASGSGDFSHTAAVKGELERSFESEKLVLESLCCCVSCNVVA